MYDASNDNLFFGYINTLETQNLRDRRVYDRKNEQIVIRPRVYYITLI